MVSFRAVCSVLTPECQDAKVSYVDHTRVGTRVPGYQTWLRWSYPGRYSGTGAWVPILAVLVIFGQVLG